MNTSTSRTEGMEGSSTLERRGLSLDLGLARRAVWEGAGRHETRAFVV